MPKSKIYAGQYGQRHVIIVHDEDDAVLDLSTATAKAIVFEDPDGNQTEEPAAFVTDGTDGRIYYRVTNGDAVDDEAGRWKCWAKVTFSGSQYISTPQNYTVHTPGQG